jgi:hypothetical protein
VRFESTLMPGQKVVVSTPGKPVTKTQTVEFLRRGDHILVEAASAPIIPHRVQTMRGEKYGTGTSSE